MCKKQKNLKNTKKWSQCKEQAYIWPVSLAHNPAWVIVRHLRQCAHRRPDSNSELWWCTWELWYIYSKISCQNLIVGHGPTWILLWLLHSESFSLNYFRWFTWNNSQWYGGYYTPKQCSLVQKKIRSEYYYQHIFSKIRLPYYLGDYIPHHFLGLFTRNNAGYYSEYYPQYCF